MAARSARGSASASDSASAEQRLDIMKGVAGRWRTGPALAALVGMLLGAVPSAFGQQVRTDEYEVKANFLVNFAKFVTWPSSQEPLVLAVVGVDPFGPYLDAIVRGKTVNGRSIVVKRIQAGESLNGCHVVFVSESESARTAEILEPMRHAPILTVGETQRFLRDGGMIRLVVEENRVRFQIDANRAEAAGLRVSSQLLSLAAR
jgi:hypothetical protein